MQVCTSLQTDNQASTSLLSFLQAGCPSCRPTNSVKALKAKSNWHINLKIAYICVCSHMFYTIQDREVLRTGGPTQCHASVVYACPSVTNQCFIKATVRTEIVLSQRATLTDPTASNKEIQVSPKITVLILWNYVSNSGLYTKL